MSVCNASSHLRDPKGQSSEMYGDVFGCSKEGMVLSLPHNKELPDP
jgi:hypothetical protein